MSVVTLNIVDVATGSPLPGATVNVNGSPQGASDNNGNFTVTANDTDTITVTNVGYSAYSFQLAYLEGDSQVQLSRINSILPAVVVTPGGDASGSNLGLLVIAGIAIVAATSKGKSVSGVSKKKVATIAGIGVLAIGGYLLLKKSSTPTTTVPPATLAPAGGAAAPASGLLSTGSSILKSLTNLFGGSSNPGAANFVPVGIDTSTQQPPPSVAAQYPTLNPNAGVNLPALEAPATTVQPPDTSLDFSTVDYGDVSTLTGLPDPVKKKLGSVPPSPLVLGALGLCCVGGAKKISGDNTNYTPLIWVAVIGGGIYLLTKALPNLFTGLFNAPNANDTLTTQTTTQTTQQSLNQAAAAGDRATITSAQASGIADSIYNYGTESTVDQDGIVGELEQVGSLTDLLLVKQNFGSRQASSSMLSLCYPININCQQYDLDGFLTQTLDSDHITEVNNYLSTRGINYSF